MPLAVLAVATLANVALWDVPAPVLSEIAWADLALNFAVRIINPLDGPPGEEPGSRGYALPQPQSDRSRLHGGLILATLVTLWHLPIVVVGMLPQSRWSRRSPSHSSTSGSSTTPAEVS
jgi:hypothetical protein